MIFRYGSGRVPGLNAKDFEEITKEAEKDCIISKALNIAITSEPHFTV